MKVKFSRHAKRRAKLYELQESSLERILADLVLSEGEHEIIEPIAGYTYPIKMVVSVEHEIITVITNYPLKKGRDR